MNYIIKNGIKCHWNFKLLPPSFLAITLFGHVFFRNDKEFLEKYLNSYNGEVTINHESIHILQADSFKTKYLGFYIIYISEWIKNIFKYGIKNNIAYYNISFEREAYQNETNFNYINECNGQSKWKNYRD